MLRTLQQHNLPQVSLTRRNVINVMIMYLEKECRGQETRTRLENLEPESLENLEPDRLENLEPESLENLEPDSLENLEPDSLENLESLQNHQSANVILAMRKRIRKSSH